MQPFETSSVVQIRELQQAACQNDIQLMEEVLQRPQDPDLASGVGGGAWPPLHFACTFGHAASVRLLLEAYADKDKVSDDGTTPIMLATERDHPEVVRLLLEASADKDSINNDGASGLLLKNLN